MIDNPFILHTRRRIDAVSYADTKAEIEITDP